MSKQPGAYVVIILGALNTITPLSIDMYLPAFPAIAKQLHSDVSTVALSVSSYFLGFALGQILYGPLLDKYGRKKPLYVGLIIYMLACIGCLLSPTIQIFIALRFLQALAGCVASVSALAMVRDFFPVNESAKIISYMMLIIAVSPMLAPTIGSAILNSFSWHYIFIVLALIAFIMLLVTAFILPQARKPDASLSLRPAAIITGFKNVITHSQFYVFSLAGTFAFACLFVYVAASPSIFLEEFKVTAGQYGLIFAGLSVGLVGGSQLNIWLTKKYSGAVIMKTCITIQLITTIIFLLGVYMHWFGLTAILCCLFVILSCSGINYPNAAGIALAPFENNAGTASALLGFIQIGVGGLISSTVGTSYLKGSIGAACVMVLSTLLAFVIIYFGMKKIATEASSTQPLHI